MLAESEQRVLRTFRRFLMTPNRMLCFDGASVEQNRAAFEVLIDKELLVRERFKGGYSLTRAGYAAMNNDCR
jgi:hypothetical protein